MEEQQRNREFSRLYNEMMCTTSSAVAQLIGKAAGLTLTMYDCERYLFVRYLEEYGFKEGNPRSTWHILMRIFQSEQQTELPEIVSNMLKYHCKWHPNYVPVCEGRWDDRLETYQQKHGLSIISIEARLKAMEEESKCSRVVRSNLCENTIEFTWQEVKKSITNSNTATRQKIENYFDLDTRTDPNDLASRVEKKLGDRWKDFPEMKRLLKYIMMEKNSDSDLKRALSAHLRHLLDHEQYLLNEMMNKF